MDPSYHIHPRTIVWSTASESGPVKVRPLAQVEANGTLFFSSGQFIYKRSDGPSPSWAVVHDMGSAPLSQIGGIRGLTAVPPPAASDATSLLFIWTNSSTNQGCMYRLDADGSQHVEVCLAALMSTYLGGSQIYYTLGAYNRAMPIRDTRSGATKHLIGFLARIPCDGAAPCAEVGSPGVGPKGSTGYYSGGVFFIRTAPTAPGGAAHYALNEIGGPRAGVLTVPRPALVATRTYVASPFAGDDAVYFGGYDCNDVLAPTNTRGSTEATRAPSSPHSVATRAR